MAFSGHRPGRAGVKPRADPQQLAIEVVEPEAPIIERPPLGEGVGPVVERAAHGRTGGEAASHPDGSDGVEPIRVLEHLRFQRGGHDLRAEGVVPNALRHETRILFIDTSVAQRPQGHRGTTLAAPVRLGMVLGVGEELVEDGRSANDVRPASLGLRDPLRRSLDAQDVQEVVCRITSVLSFGNAAKLRQLRAGDHRRMIHGELAAQNPTPKEPPSASTLGPPRAAKSSLTA